jgi:hypothetical protein
LIRDNRIEGVFDFWRGIVPGNCGGSWVYLFYDAACIVVAHKKPISEVPEEVRSVGNPAE